MPPSIKLSKLNIPFDGVVIGTPVKSFKGLLLFNKLNCCDGVNVNGTFNELGRFGRVLNELLAKSGVVKPPFATTVNVGLFVVINVNFVDAVVVGVGVDITDDFDVTILLLGIFNDLFTEFVISFSFEITGVFNVLGLVLESSILKSKIINY